MSTTRGPLPPGTYWRRRVFLLGVVAAVVLLAVSLLRGGGSQESADVTARQSGAEAAPTPEPSTPGATLPTTGTPGATGTESTGQGQLVAPSAAPLADPVGRCADSDILIEPSATGAVAGQSVALTLAVSTAETEACTWEVSARHLALTLSRDGEEIWTSRECPGLIPTEDLVVRRLVPTSLVLDWSGRRSAQGCTSQRGWVESGIVEIDAAAYGGEPGEAEFDLARPEAPVIEVPEPAEPEQTQDDQTQDDQSQNSNKNDAEKNDADKSGQKNDGAEDKQKKKKKKADQAETD